VNPWLLRLPSHGPSLCEQGLVFIPVSLSILFFCYEYDGVWGGGGLEGNPPVAVFVSVKMDYAFLLLATAILEEAKASFKATRAQIY